ncbi:heavy metal translocating P-type ATPase [Eisenbergiella porci]|uniref:heavy metal translocating P-type ATPase n=1 Tax=Eisenbergiella porci TaxID=2652274 RepID=UPI002A7F0EEF|nr:heavy metal translocating P-type ATPase [Eisenbergiella porci]
MTRKLKKRLKRIIIGAAFFAAAVLLEKFATGMPVFALLAVFLAAYVIIGGDVVKRAVGNIGKGQVFDENFLMTIATVGAFFVGEYPEAVAVMLFYQVGELFQSYAVNRSRKNIAELMDIRPDFANVRRDGVEEQVDPEEVAVGETIVVKPGERIPLDGVIAKGNSSLDTMALTGESVPREVLCGEEVISGCINLTGVLEVQVSKPFGESTVSKILDLVENASSKKAEAENFITKFARYYTPIVVICAAVLAVVPPLFLGGWSTWIYRGLTFLVVSCPCAVVISVPLSFFGGLGGASRAGVLIKGSNYLEALAETEIVVMDKTGTLTKGTFRVMEVKPALENGAEVITRDELLELTAYAESYSNHPISLSIQKAYGRQLDKNRLESTEELAGHGVHAVIDGIDIYAGNEKLMRQQKISFTNAAQIGTIVHVAKNDQYLGYILIADEIKEDAAECIRGLKAEGVKRVVMLTGDRKETADYVASQIGLTEVHSELLPGDKVDEVEKIIASKSSKGKLVFVGDGINDAPVLARADIGIAMGGLGSDAAIEAADVVIMTDEPSKIAAAMRISRKTLGIVKQNIVFALGVKILVLILAAFGIANMWLAVFADVGVAVIAILNAMRAMQVKGID